MKPSSQRRLILLILALVPSMVTLTAADPQNLASELRKPLCGAHCLYVGLLALDYPVEGLEVVLKELGPPPPAGYSFAQLDSAARALGAQTLGVETTLERLASRPQRFVCIAHVHGGHFVNIGRVTADEVTFYDPPMKQTLPRVTFDAQWDGKALLLSRETLLSEDAIRIAGPARWREWAGYGAAVVLGCCGIVYMRRRLALTSSVAQTTPQALRP